MTSNEKIVMTPGQYARKTAYHIDPLLAAMVEIKPPLNPRGDEERYGTDIWKHRTQDSRGNRIWKPLTSVILILSFLGASNRHVESTFAAIPEVSTTQVQYVLKSFGYSVRVDGAFGPQTKRAIKHFQKVNGLEATGIADVKTIKALGIVNTIQSKPAKRIVGASQDQSGWHDLAISVGWSEENWPVLSCIISRESHGNPNAKNKHSSATGLLQILASHQPGIDLYDPETNLRVGLEMFNSRGWQPWTLPGHQCK